MAHLLQAAFDTGWQAHRLASALGGPWHSWSQRGLQVSDWTLAMPASRLPALSKARDWPSQATTVWPSSTSEQGYCPVWATMTLHD